MKIPRAIGRLNPAGNRWTKDSRIWIPEIGEQQRLRVDKVKKELDLEERARADAQKGQPLPADEVLNEAQLDICNRVFAGILMLNQFLAEQLGDALDRVRRVRPKPLDRKNLAARIGIEARRIFAEYRGELRRLKQENVQADVDLRYFRNKNRLKQGASYKESHLLVAGIIAALLVIESAVNGMLFRDVVRSGWLGGIMLAGVISLLNVGLGLGAGLFGWKYVGHVSWPKKVVGWLVVVVCHGFALFWNVMVAHFREVAELAARRPDYDFNFQELAAQAFAHRASEGWFGFATIFAWALFGLGMIVHFIAAREGWDDIGDRYPDYMRKDWRAKASRDAFERTLVDMRADARKAAEDVVRDAEAMAARGAEALDTIADVQNLAVQREQEVRDSEDEWVAGGTQLLRTYRDINVEVRGEMPPPAYFTSFPTPDDYRRGDFGAGLRRQEEVDVHVEAVAGAMRDLAMLEAESAEIAGANAEALNELRTEVNRVVADLDALIEGAEDDATQHAAVEADDPAKPA